MICVIFALLLPLMVQSLVVEELESLFSSKHCIEASLVSLSVAQNEGVMLDSTTTSHTQTSENTSPNFDKTVTSTINELAQYNDIEYVYKLTSEEGPPHAKTYTVNLLLGDESYEGTGPSLKKAQQVAAGSALDNTLYEHPPHKIKEDKTLTPTVALNNIATKLGIAVSYYVLTGKEEEMIESYGPSDEAYAKLKNYPKWNSSSDPFRVPSEEPQISGPFMVRVQVGDLIFKGVGHTIQAARHDAAFRAIKTMEEKAFLEDGVCKDESLGECKRKRESLKSPISRVYEAAQTRNLPLEFIVISESGEPHKKVFITQCKLGDYVTEGEGGSKKESKRVAAEKMLENLPQLRRFYDENAIINRFGNKKKKKKKNKVLRSDSNFVQTVSSMVFSVWKGSDDTKPTNNRKSGPGSTKDKLLEIVHGLNIAVDFIDLDKHDGSFSSLVSLGVRPPYICLGKAATRDKSHESAALHGIKLLYKVGLFEKAQLSQYHLSDEFDTENKLGNEAVVISLKNGEKDED